MERTRGFAACGLWVLASLLMVYGTLDYHRDGTPAGFAWGVFTAVVAASVTGWEIMEKLCLREDTDVTVETIAEVVDALHDAKADVARLISPKS